MKSEEKTFKEIKQALIGEGVAPTRIDPDNFEELYEEKVMMKSGAGRRRKGEEVQVKEEPLSQEESKNSNSEPSSPRSEKLEKYEAKWKDEDKDSDEAEPRPASLKPKLSSGEPARQSSETKEDFDKIEVPGTVMLVPESYLEYQKQSRSWRAQPDHPKVEEEKDEEWDEEIDYDDMSRTKKEEEQPPPKNEEEMPQPKEEAALDESSLVYQSLKGVFSSRSPNRKAKKAEVEKAKDEIVLAFINKMKGVLAADCEAIAEGRRATGRLSFLHELTKFFFMHQYRDSFVNQEGVTELTKWLIQLSSEPVQPAQKKVVFLAIEKLKLHPNERNPHLKKYLSKSVNVHTSRRLQRECSEVVLRILRQWSSIDQEFYEARSCLPVDLTPLDHRQFGNELEQSQQPRTHDRNRYDPEYSPIIEPKFPPQPNSPANSTTAMKLSPRSASPAKEADLPMSSKTPGRKLQESKHRRAKTRKEVMKGFITKACGAKSGKSPSSQSPQTPRAPHLKKN